MRKKVKSFDNTYINYDIARRDNNKFFLVFLHGIGSNLKSWKKVRGFFHRMGISTVAIDLRGHGKSSRPKFLEDYNLQNFARDVKAVIKKENIRNPIIIGHSLGGMIALTFHKLYPKLSKEYVIISSSYRTPKKLKLFIKKFSSAFDFINKKLEKLNPPSIASYGNNPFFNDNDLDFGRILHSIKETSMKSWLFTMENISRFNEEGILGTIKKPVLILSGGKDKVIDVDNSKRLHSLIKQSKLKIFPKENHIIIFNNPKKVSEEIYSFLMENKYKKHLCILFV